MDKSRIELIHGAMILGGAATGLLWESSLPLVWFGLMSFSGVVYAGWPRERFGHFSGGMANWVTLARLLLIFIAMLMYPGMGNALFTSFAIFILILDGVDGYIARKRGEQTQFGAYFDLETDAFFAACLSMLLVLYFEYSPFILFAGLLRYYFLFLKRITGLHRIPTPSMPGVKLMAVVYFISLITPFVLPAEWARWLVGLGILLVVFSFGRELFLLAGLRSADH